jgi:hypothetical protein
VPKKSDPEVHVTIATVSQGNPSSLPQALSTAQEAIHLPEVQAILRSLSAYKLGIFMPHMHDERTGQFQTLPDDVMQVESGLQVSFQPAAEVANQTGRFLPVAWIWRAGASTAVAACEMASGEDFGDKELSKKHDMKPTNAATG